MAAAGLVKVRVSVPRSVVWRIRGMMWALRAYVRLARPTESERAELEALIGRHVLRITKNRIKAEHV